MKKLGIALVLVTSHFIVGLASYVFTKLDTQSYYAAAVQELIMETQASVDAQDTTFGARLRRFAAAQPLTYEGRSDLLENLRLFRAEGEAIRGQTSTSD